MATIHPGLSTTQTHIASSRNLNFVHRFFDWCKIQEKNRLGWLAAILAIHGCVLTPLTLCIVAFTPHSFIVWPFIIGAIGMCLVTNLAAMPTRVTIPVFFFSILIDVVVIGNGIAMAVAAA